MADMKSWKIRCKIDEEKEKKKKKKANSRESG